VTGVKFVSTSAGRYDVLLNGVLVGAVHKRVTNYRNIRFSGGRMGGKYTTWDAYVGHEKVVHGERTRMDAAAALVARAI
jgi:hypothetical protein